MRALLTRIVDRTLWKSSAGVDFEHRGSRVSRRSPLMLSRCRTFGEPGAMWRPSTPPGRPDFRLDRMFIRAIGFGRFGREEVYLGD
jgi:hypothetical protein